MPIANHPVWQRGVPSDLPRLSSTVEADVCVIGLGGSGLACILELLARGKRVVGLDAATVAAGAAGANGGFLLGGLAMFHHDAAARFGSAAAAAIYRETLDQIERMAAGTPAAVRRTGSMRRAASAEEMEDCRVQLEAMRRDGLPVEMYEGPDGSGLSFPADCAFDPAARCLALATDARSRGAQLFGHSPVVSLGDGTAATPGGTVRAPHIVVAVDGRLDVLLPELASRVRSARLQMLATAPAPEVQVPRPVYSRWGLDYWQQLPDARIALGGARDVGGDPEWTTDAHPTDAVQQTLERLLHDQVGARAPVTHRWAAIVGYTQSGLPILEQVRPGLWAIGGYCGTGNVVGALCGRAVAELIVDGRSEVAALLRA